VLYILKLLLFIILLFSKSGYAESRFFDSEEVNFFKKNTLSKENTYCESCNSTATPKVIDSNFNPELEKKVNYIIEKITNQFKKTERDRQKAVYLFVDPKCNFSKQAVRVLADFQERHPTWQNKGYLITPLNNLKDTILRNKDYFKVGIPFTLDIKNTFCEKYNIVKSPTFVILYRGKHYKIAGQPNLEDIIVKIR